MFKSAYDRKKLKCGCVPGLVLCPAAQRLWSRADTLYQESRAQNYSRESWARYEEARAAYDDHVVPGGVE